MLGPRQQQQPMSSEDLLASALDDSDFDELTAAELEDLYYRYTNNTVYVLDASDSCGEVEGLVKLFGSPAGRALVEATASTSATGGHAASNAAASSAGTEAAAPCSSTAPASAAAAAAAAVAAAARRKHHHHRRRSSAELYKEAAALLGLACSMTDSCRCIECQSRYFDCDQEEARADTGLAAGTPALLDLVLTHPMSCTLQ